MHWIRFLKKPSLVRTTNRFPEYKLEAKITITTDLQESLLQNSTGISAIVQDASGHQIVQQYRWQSTSRSVDISFTIRPKELPTGWSLPYRLGIAPDPKLNLYRLEDVAKISFTQTSAPIWGIQPVWSNDLWDGRDVGTRVERLLILPDDTTIRIWEESGNSLTAHIWDSGLVLSAVLYSLSEMSQVPPPNNAFPILRSVLAKPKLNVLELGTGCGVVGITMAHCFHGAVLQLTDVPEAEELAAHNVDLARTKLGDRIEYQNLDWELPIPDTVTTESLDIVLVSDCTYNTVSIPYLVNTLVSLLEKSNDAIILIATKRRHESEKLFVDLMKETDIFHESKMLLPLPRLGELDQVIEIDTYQHGSKGPPLVLNSHEIAPEA